MTLTEDGVFIVAFFIVLIVFGFILWLILKIMDWHLERQEAKRKNEHPELYRLISEADAKSLEASRWHNQQIAPRKNQIDRLIAEMPYFPKEVKAQKEEELERLRREVYTANTTKKVLNDEYEELREKVHDYIEDHDVKWAKDWGW